MWLVLCSLTMALIYLLKCFILGDFFKPHVVCFAFFPALF